MKPQRKKTTKYPEKIKINITQRDIDTAYRESKGDKYYVCIHCPFARATQRKFPKDEISVGYKKIRINGGNVVYEGDEKLDKFTTSFDDYAMMFSTKPKPSSFTLYKV